MKHLRTRLAAPLFSAGLLLSACTARAQPWPEVPASAEVAAAFSVPTPAGPSVQLSDLAGKVVVLNLWATWCAPCLQELPDLGRMARDLDGEGLRVVGVAEAQSDTSRFAALATRYAVGYPLAFPDTALPASYGPRNVWPSTFLIDRAGRVRLYLQGPTTYDELLPLVKSLLAEPAP